MPPESAEIYFMIGTCQVELKDYNKAHDAFNDAIKVDGKFAEVRNSEVNISIPILHNQHSMN